MLNALTNLQTRRQANGKSTPFLDGLLNAGGVRGLLDERRAMGQRPVLDFLGNNANSLLGLGAGLLAGGDGRSAMGWMEGSQLDTQNRQQREQQNALSGYLPTVPGMTQEALQLASAFPEFGLGIAAQQFAPAIGGDTYGPILTGEDAQALGLDPTKAWQQSPEGQWKQVGDNPLVAIDLGSTGAERPEIGTPEAGMQYVWDEPSQSYVAQEIPGGVAERERLELERAAEGEAARQEQVAGIVLGAIDQIEGIMDRNPGLIGFWNPAAEAFNHPDAVALRGYVDTIESAIAIDRLLQMKALSPTGASGFGALQKAELDLLKAWMGSLRTAQNIDHFRYNLNQVMTIYQDILGTLTAPAAQGQSYGQWITEGTPTADNNGWIDMGDGILIREAR